MVHAQETIPILNAKLYDFSDSTDAYTQEKKQNTHYPRSPPCACHHPYPPRITGIPTLANLDKHFLFILTFM